MQNSSIFQIFEKYPDDAAAERFFEERRWPEGVCCPQCDSKNIARVKNAVPMPFRCRTCRKHFSVRTGTFMAESALGHHRWLLGIYLFQTSKKRISSVDMGMALGITHSSAWLLCLRLRSAMASGDEMLISVMEAE